MDLVDRLLIALMVLMLMYVAALVGSASKEYEMLDLYCKSFSGQHEEISDVDYCIVDNQLQVIEWAND